MCEDFVQDSRLHLLVDDHRLTHQTNENVYEEVGVAGRDIEHAQAVSQFTTLTLKAGCNLRLRLQLRLPNALSCLSLAVIHHNRLVGRRCGSVNRFSWLEIGRRVTDAMVKTLQPVRSLDNLLSNDSDSDYIYIYRLIVPPQHLLNRSS